MYLFRIFAEAKWEYAAHGGKLSQSCKYSGSNDVGLRLDMSK